MGNIVRTCSLSRNNQIEIPRFRILKDRFCDFGVNLHPNFRSGLTGGANHQPKRLTLVKMLSDGHDPNEPVDGELLLIMRIEPFERSRVRKINANIIFLTKIYGRLLCLL